MLQGKCFAFATWILSLGLGFLPGECELGVFFPAPCDVPIVEFNDVIRIANEELCVTTDGKIYSLQLCTLTEKYQVPGSHSLNAISNSPIKLVTVGNAGTIVRDRGLGEWILVDSPTQRNLRDVCYYRVAVFLSHFAVGDSGTIIKSFDDGQTWFLLPSPTAVNLYRMECVDGALRVFGEDVGGFTSSDGGTTWDTIPFYGANALASPDAQNGGPDLYTSFFLDDNNGYVFGEFGVAFKTTNGGSIWQAGFVPGFNRINTAFFVSRDSGMVAGDNGKIRFTTDGGVSWFEDSIASSLTTQNINHIDVSLTDSLAVIVGDSGTVIFVVRDSTLLDVSPDGMTIPVGFELRQNYPNPFNPSTTFTFTIPHSSFTILSVYDILGREVASIVNEELPPGRYAQEWDASAFASGVYFYRIEAHQTSGQVTYVGTKKLLLLR